MVELRLCFERLRWREEEGGVWWREEGDGDFSRREGVGDRLPKNKGRL